MLHYYRLPYVAPYSSFLKNIAEVADASHWQTHHEFKVLPVQRRVIEQDNCIINFLSKYDYRTGIIRMEPNQVYDWHVDGVRKTAINMQLSAFGASYCLFGEQITPHTRKVDILKYEPNSYYIFNTQAPHMVLNTCDVRYLLSFEFIGKDEDLTFEQLFEHALCTYDRDESEDPIKHSANW